MDAVNLALSRNWMDSTAAPTVAVNAMSSQLSSSGIAQMTSNCIDYGQYGYWYPWTISSTTPAKPIRLSLSEVEKLKKAAKADEGLRAILAKFTDQIEVIVDFGK